MPSLVEDPDGTLRLVVDTLGYDLEPSVLIGGWATYLRVGGEISHDIDLILGDDSVRQKLRDRLDELSESTHLPGTKWSGEVEGVHLDIYIPFQSQLGQRLMLRVEVLRECAEPADDQNQRWLLLNMEAHTISKMAALLDRWHTAKGVKDANEVLALLRKGVDARSAVQILAKATAGSIHDVPSHIDDAFTRVIDRATLNRTDKRWLEQLRREWLDSAAEVVRRAGDPGERARPILR